MAKCEWTYDPDGYYETACGGAQVFEIGDIDDNLYKYCPYCGKEIIEVVDANPST